MNVEISPEQTHKQKTKRNASELKADRLLLMGSPESSHVFLILMHIIRL